MFRNREPRFKLTQKGLVRVWFAAALLFLCALEWMDWNEVARMEESAAVVAHANVMESELNRLLVLVEDIESGVRGYILTGNPEFLAPYETAQKGLPEQQRLLTSLIRDPHQRDWMNELESLIARRMEISRRNIELRQTAGLEAAGEAVSAGTGKAVMDRIRAIYAQMLDRNNTLLNLRSNEAERRVTVSRQIRFVGKVLSVVLLSTILVLLMRENKLRQKLIIALSDRENEAKRANHAKTEFLSRMSHELRTPLNSILGFSQLIQQQQENLTDDQKNAVLLITQSGQHLQQLINEALDITHIESGRIVLHEECVAVGEIIRECLTLLESGARMQDIKLQVNGSIDWMIVVDRFRFKQVLLNLITNAIKYNRPNGSVTLECTPADRRLRLSVIDTGIGIPQDKMAEVFTPFSRFAMEKCEGTGIGLTITRLLVEAMGGEIGFSSAPGAGSTFWVEFLRERRSTPRAPHVHRLPSENMPQADPAWATMTGKILYVEDTPANVQLLRMVLKRYLPGVSLLDAGTAEHGIELAKAEQPHLILMDISLPGMSGIEAFRKLQNELTTCSIPVIALSATAMQRDIDKAMEAGFNSYITKPFDIQAIPGIIARYMPRKE